MASLTLLSWNKIYDSDFAGLSTTQVKNGRVSAWKLVAIMGGGCSKAEPRRQQLEGREVTKWEK